MKNLKTYDQTLLLLAANSLFLRFRFSNTFTYVPIPVLEKRYFRCALASLIICFCLIQPARAAQFSGDYLLQVCGVNAKGEEIVEGGHIACQAYIAGIMDYHGLIRSLGTAPSVDFCVPEDVSMHEVQKNVANYIYDNHHEQGPFIAAPGVALALFKAYPCPE